jgi:hypothetical protein
MIRISDAGIEEGVGDVGQQLGADRHRHQDDRASFDGIKVLNSMSVSVSTGSTSISGLDQGAFSPKTVAPGTKLQPESKDQDQEDAGRKLGRYREHHATDGQQIPRIGNSAAWMIWHISASAASLYSSQSVTLPLMIRAFIPNSLSRWRITCE